MQSLNMEIRANPIIEFVKQKTATEVIKDWGACVSNVGQNKISQPLADMLENG